MSAARVAGLSALVVVHNEARQLAACLDCLRFAGEIVVVLDRCADESAAIAARYTDRLLPGAWDLEGPRRNAGIAACAGPWVLEIDADERVSQDLAAEIASVVAASPFDWHELPIQNYIGDRLVRWGWGPGVGRSAHAGLFRKAAKIWGSQRVHPRLELRGRMGPRLKAPLDHYVDRNISDMIRRLDRYTTARAADLRETGEIGGFGANVRRMISRFYKCYVGRKGYREGPYGFLLALMAGLYPILSYLKARLEPE
jgi:glycosyltransferase involved in cell wall biosynthesis